MVIRNSFAHLTEVKLLPLQKGGYSKALELPGKDYFRVYKQCFSKSSLVVHPYCAHFGTPNVHTLVYYLRSYGITNLTWAPPM